MGLFSETFSSSQKLSCSAGVQGIKISTELRSNAVANCTRGGRQFVYPGRCGERAQPGRLRFYGRWGRGSRQMVGALGGFFFSKPREFVWGSKKFRSELHGYLKKDETDAFVPSRGTRSSRSACKSSGRNGVKEQPQGEGRGGSILARAAGFSFLDAEEPGRQAYGVLQESDWRGASPARSDAKVRVAGGTRPRPLWQSPAAVWPVETSTRTQQPAALMAHKRGCHLAVRGQGCLPALPPSLCLQLQGQGHPDCLRGGRELSEMRLLG